MLVARSSGWMCAVLVALSVGMAHGAEAFRADFAGDWRSGWAIEEGEWSVSEGRAEAVGGFAKLLTREEFGDARISADVAFSHDGTHAAAGLLFRIAEDGTGFAACVREVEKGRHPEHGPWERPVLQLFCVAPDGWKLLQESKVAGWRPGELRQLLVVCEGAEIRVHYEDEGTPVLRTIADHAVRVGRAGVWKDAAGVAEFANFSVVPAGSNTESAASQADWSGVRGAIYVRSNAVNSVEMWHDYWDHVELLDRELSFAALYGFNMVQAYLHWIVWDRHRDEYLSRIEDFVARAASRGLAVNFILWDDCGHVEPSLTFAPPIPGRHNSQMMPNPSHRIRDSEVELSAHEGRFRDYVEGVATRFRNDPRIAFWQLYNEAMGPKELYRDGEADRNIDRLLGWTRDWIKGAGCRIPVTATGGGFHGSKYSDFYTYHSYAASPEAPLPNADGGPGQLCTETLNRPNAGIERCMREIAGKENGFVVWELMIGRDNCRFPWGHPDGLDEPAEPFHGVVYPDGHPWSVDEVRALLGDERFRELEKNTFRVGYFDGVFGELRTSSITPAIDFDIGDEPGTGSPDASAGIGRDHFSIRWEAEFRVAEPGEHVFAGDSDGSFRVWVDDRLVCENGEGRVALDASRAHRIRVEYVHETGEARATLRWSGPGVIEQVFRPRNVGHEDG